MARATDILIPIHDFPLGGTERIAIRLANRWAHQGRRVTLFCGERSGPLKDLIDASVHVEACATAIPRGRGSRRRLGRATADYVRATRPGVLFTPGNFHWPILPHITQLPAAQRPRIFAQISTPLLRPDRGPLRQVAFDARMRRSFRGIDGAISLSHEMTAQADRILGRAITRRIALPALDDSAPPPTPWPHGAASILAAGRLVAEKGFDLALRAFAALGDPSATLVIVGEGPERAALGALAQALGVADRVSFPGYVPDIRPWLDRAHLLLLTSHYEGYAAVVVEALAAGRPVAATRCTPAADELLYAPERGVVVPLGDAAALAQGMRDVLAREHVDVQALAAAVQGYRLEDVATAYLDLFDAAPSRAVLRQSAPPPLAFGEPVAFPA